MDNLEQNESWLERNKFVFIFLGVFLVLAIVIVFIFLVIRMTNEAKTKIPPPAPIATSTPIVEPVATTTATLPVIGEVGTTTNASSTSASEQLAEKASFGSFYRPTTSKIVLSPANIALPLNVKTEVANYYDIDRKMSLDSGLASLNNNGFAVLDNPFSGEANNFFSAYSALDARQIPTLITGDFLIYYYQNVLKLAYKEVEGTIFYDNLWAADWRLYQIAKQRYEDRLNQKGATNDVALEAARLEMAYFATALSLLAPTDNQISSATTGLSASTNFSTAEASQYSLQLPAYLQDDVGQELKLIRAADSTAKSPVLLYPRDYKIFAVPENYKSNARLYNFYLASRWLNSVFPLYYRDSSCPNCLLDRDDWRINFSAAFLISADLASDQNLKNRWAKIYKLQSFFSGLRSDLNYLNYSQTFADSFSGQSDITKILQGTPSDNDANLSLLQDKLAKINFSALEGGLNKAATTTQPILGFKMLTDSYWPDSYIFSQLSYPAVGKFLGDSQSAKVATACSLPDKKGYYRCTGQADDILNLIYPLNNQTDNYFASNTNYENYGRQALALQKMLVDFNVDSWHANTFWTTLDIAAKFLHAPEIAKVSVMKNAAWQNKNLNTALASWANGELPADIFAPYASKDSARLNQADASNLTATYEYIEPDLTLTRELIFNTQMIVQMLGLLNVSDGENTVLPDLKAMEKNLTDAETIIAKELQNKELSDDDYSFIKDFTHVFSVSHEGDKSFNLPAISGGKLLTENLTGVKLMVYSFGRGGQKFFAVGPVFNYREEKK